MSQGSHWLGLSDAVNRIAAGVGRFVRYEIDLAAAEAREDLARLLKSTRLLMGSVLVGIAALATSVATAIAVLTAVLVAFGMSATIASSLACFLATLAFGGVAWMLYANARTGMRDLGARLERIVAVFAESASQPRPAAAPIDESGKPVS